MIGMKNVPSINHVYKSIYFKRIWILISCSIAFMISFFLDVSIGSSRMPLNHLFLALIEGPFGQKVETIVVWGIRLPMSLTSIFVGGSLAIAGLQLQTITNNPLASPYTFGITSGASFGAAISIMTGFSIAGQLWLGTSLMAFVVAFIVSLSIFYMGKIREMSTTTLLLIGMMMNFFFTALQQLLQYRASAEIAPDYFQLDIWKFSSFVMDKCRGQFITNG